jgi:mono/diheme cytochrome c family protein
MASSWRAMLGIVLISSLAGSSMLALQGTARNVSDGVYTAAQATRGQTVYTAKCASCHAPNLTGRSGPPLVGDDFLQNWSSQPLSELANKIGRTMPRDTPDRLTPEQTADVLAYVLQVGKFPAGTAELRMDETALKSVSFPARPARPAPAVAGSIPSLPAAGNVGQVMRGILFPSANIVFTVQSIDPGAKRPEVKDGAPDGGFDWFSWGNSVYSGWDVVDYASIAVAESASLMLTPGRKCENGRAVPLSDPDWIKFTNELLDAGKASYKASQSRNQEAVSKSTDQLNASCNNCHRVYRGRTHCVKN